LLAGEPLDGDGGVAIAVGPREDDDGGGHLSLPARSSCPALCLASPAAATAARDGRDRLGHDDPPDSANTFILRGGCDRSRSPGWPAASRTFRQPRAGPLPGRCPKAPARSACPGARLRPA